jgi:hypothetical protein
MDRGHTYPRVLDRFAGFIVQVAAQANGSKPQRVPELDVGKSSLEHFFQRINCDGTPDLTEPPRMDDDNNNSSTMYRRSYDAVPSGAALAF